jgi:putative transposase
VTVGDMCRAVWNTGLEQRREYRRRGADRLWGAGAAGGRGEEGPRLRLAGRGTVARVAADAAGPGPGLPHPRHMEGAMAEKVADRGVVSIPGPQTDSGAPVEPTAGSGAAAEGGLGAVPVDASGGGAIRNATVRRDGGRWYVSFCVEDGVPKAALNGQPAVGVDRGVAVAVATSDGWLRDRDFVTPGEAKRLRRLQQRLARQKDKRSNRRKANPRRLGHVERPGACSACRFHRVDRGPARPRSWSGRGGRPPGVHDDPVGDGHRRGAGQAGAAEGRG